MQLRAKVGSETNIPIGVARGTLVRPILLLAVADVAYFPPRRRNIVILNGDGPPRPGRVALASDFQEGQPSMTARRAPADWGVPGEPVA
jgi:hypothetical protein